jgi:CubicO group peptidase (beta-lactamase class C family)
MTKSFTATQVLMLADSGALRLDDPARDYVPELSGVELPSRDCPQLTIRHLLTMTAGFPTDDPWGDRQQGLDPAEFAALLAGGGVRSAWAPGTRFEYSNLGYAVLGKVIAKVTGGDYAKAIRENVLQPLGMNRTGFEASEFDPASVARGYQRCADQWEELDPDPHGAFAPMGGIFSTVRDLARWTAGFAAAFPPRPGAADDHPLSRAMRRQMQMTQVTISAERAEAVLQLGGGSATFSYGFGLFIEDDQEFGNVVQHSGGYPGYGSQMRWHPDSGLGAIVLANGTYAWAGRLANNILKAAMRAEARRTRGSVGAVAARGPMPEPGPWPETLAAKEDVDGLLAEWDDGVAARLFTANVELDQPLQQRRADVDRLRERIGTFEPDSTRPAECESPAHCQWWVTGAHGTASVQIKLAPLTQARVQQLAIAVPPAVGSGLQAALDTLIGAVNEGAPQWPAGLTVAAGIKTDDILRHLRVAAAWAGSCRLDCYLAGDGDTSVTVRLVGESGTVTLAVGVSKADGALQRATISLVR